MVADMPPGLQPLTGGREMCFVTGDWVLDTLSFSLDTSVGLPHGSSQT